MDMSTSAWAVIGGLGWAAVCGGVGLLIIRGIKPFDHTAMARMVLNRTEFSGVLMLRCNGLIFVAIGFLGLIAASTVATGMVTNFLAAASDATAGIAVAGLAIFGLVFMPLVLWMSRTGRPQFLVPPAIRGWSTDEVNALFEVSASEVRERLGVK